MTPQRRLIQCLDRPGLRPLLAMLASQYARRKTGLDVEVFYDQAWIRRAGDRYLAESASFDWTAAQVAGWKDRLADVLEAATTCTEPARYNWLEAPLALG